MKIFRLLFTSISFCFLSHLCSTLESTAVAATRPISKLRPAASGQRPFLVHGEAPCCNTLRCATNLGLLGKSATQGARPRTRPAACLLQDTAQHSYTPPSVGTKRSNASWSSGTLDGQAECVVELAKRQCHCLRPGPSSRQWQSEVIEECGLLI